MDPERFSGLMGLARRAGLTACGVEITLEKVRRHQAVIVFVDDGASDNTRKKIMDSCSFYDIRCVLLEDGLMDRALGLSGCRATALMKGSLTDEIIRLMEARSLSN